VKVTIKAGAILLLSAVCAAQAYAQTIKIGSVLTLSGPNATLGENMDRAIKLYMKLNQDKLPPGVKVEVITRDDGGPNPDKAKQLSQELIVRDKVQFLAGMTWTPNAMSSAPLATEAKVPMVIMNAGTSAITTMSPYIVRLSFTLWQSSLPMGIWAAKKFKTAYIAVSDFGPGHDAQAAFTKGFSDGGGKIVGEVRIPLANPDFIPFMQRAKDAKPDAIFGFVPAGKQATAIMKAYGDLGLDKAGVKFIGPGDITTDEELPNMGDVPLGVLTVFHYSAAAGGRLGRNGRDLLRHPRAERQGRSGQIDGAVQAVQESEQPAWSDLDRSRDPRHRPERVLARGAQDRRQARERRAGDRAERGQGSLEDHQQQEIIQETGSPAPRTPCRGGLFIRL
jgi:branched-chain amino acid transport system substrate-binding protein